MALHRKHKLFADEYLVDLNATQAYLRAGYKVSERVAAVNGLRLLARQDVQAYIDERQAALQKKTEIKQEWVLEELRRVAAANAADFAKIQDGSVRFTDTESLSEEKLSALAGIKEGKFGIEVRLHDKVRALELLARHLGLLNDKLEHGGSVDVGQDKLAAILEQLK